MKHIKRISLIVVAFLVLTCSVPLSSMAVDPVSTATMANALAQAITAYGASQGVSMTFDVANTDGIGEGVHELWDDFKEDVQDENVPTYDSFAVTVWSTLFSKIGDKVAVNLDANSVSYIDAFWNWLLSGPAEMQKVDDQYYQWTLNQSGNVSPIVVYSVSAIPNQPLPLVQSTSELNTNGFTYAMASNTSLKIGCDADDGYAFIYGSTYNHLIIISTVQNRNFRFYKNYNTIITGRNYDLYTYNGNNVYYSSYDLSGVTSVNVPTFQTMEEALQYFVNVSSGVITGDDLSIQPYVGDAVPQDVYIPDNEDVNYEPIPAQIPLDINWDETLFGDGTETLTDAQSEAVTGAIDNAINENPAKTIELADTTNPPVPSPSEVYIPFLPVTLPSFQFSLSGIWHYVTAWVASLGAWFSLVFTTWSYLPYAISVPVYATAVIVIVLGVYKRFFM